MIDHQRGSGDDLVNGARQVEGAGVVFQDAEGQGLDGAGVKGGFFAHPVFIDLAANHT